MTESRLVEAELQFAVDLGRLPVLPYRFIDPEKHAEAVANRLDVPRAVAYKQVLQTFIKLLAQLLLLRPVGRVGSQVKESLSRMHHQHLTVVGTLVDNGSNRRERLHYVFPAHH